MVVPFSSSQSISPRPFRRWNSCCGSGVLGQELGLGGVVLQVHLLLADLGGVQRRLGDVHVAGLDQRAHLAVEERQQQGADVAAVDVGVGEQRSPCGSGPWLTSNSSPTPPPMAVISALDLVVLQHLVEAGPLDVEDLAADRQQRLRSRIAGVEGGAAGGVALDDEQLALARRPLTSSP